MNAWRKRGPTLAEAHVRLYKHELESRAYRSLSCEARSLLIELRTLYAGRENRVFMSIREIMRRINAGQRKAVKARDELLDRGFIRVLETGSFSRKTPHATTYALTNEPLTQRDGDTAPKDFMRWQPEKNTVVKMHTDGMRSEYREPMKPPGKEAHGMQNDYRQAPKTPNHGMQNDYTDIVTTGTGKAGAAGQAYDWWKLALFQESGPQFKFCLALAALNYSHGAAA